MKKHLILALLLILCGCTKTEEVPLSATEIPVFRIVTDGKAPIVVKEAYLNAQMTVEGAVPFSGKIEIRGRGNTTWSFPKKPFKIRLNEKNGLLNGLPAREWVLLANYLDPSLMHNAVAMEIGKLLKMPFTNTIKPIDLWVNNEYLGNYMLTEQVEAKENRVEVGENGFLLSLDTIIDPDDIYFVSNTYRLPVIVKYPKTSDNPRFNLVQQEFNELEDKIASANFPNTTYLDYFDADEMAKYLVVYTLTCNEEINHPKSTYIYKKPSGKFTIGPIWDFDWAFSYEQNRVHYINPERPLFWDRKSKGTVFFERIASDPKIQALVKTQWQRFRENDFAKLLAFVDTYAVRIETSRAADFKKWQRGESNFDVEKEALKNWLELRARYMDKLVATY